MHPLRLQLQCHKPEPADRLMMSPLFFAASLLWASTLYASPHTQTCLRGRGALRKKAGADRTSEIAR